MRKDALAVFNSKASTTEQKAKAMKVLSDLEAYTENRKKGETISDSSVVLEKDENKYPYDQQEVIEGYEDAVNVELLAQIEKVKSGEYKDNDTVYFSGVSPSAANEIKGILGIDVSGFKSAIEARQIRHILNRHGEKGNADTSMRNDSDIARIEFVLNNFDSIEYGGRAAGYTTNKGNGYTRQADTVLYSKKINGTYYVVQAVPDTSKKTLYVVSAFIDNKKEAGKTVDTNGPGETSGNDSTRASDIQKSRSSHDASSNPGSKTLAVTDFSANSKSTKDGLLNMSNDPQYTSETPDRVNGTSANDSISQKGRVVNSELIEMTQGMSREDADFFIKTYDGKSDIGAYAESFGAVYGFAKDNYTKATAQDFILEHRGVLTERQAQSIYNRAVTEPRTAEQRNIDRLVSKYSGKTMAQSAVINDSVIDYRNRGTKGKVNWNSLNERQRSAITFIKAFAKLSGTNLTVTADGEKRGCNGYYDPSDNTIYIDVKAGIYAEEGILDDAIIPTLAHELTHWMKKKSPALYAELSEKVFDALKKAAGKSEAALIAEEAAKYEKNHPGKTMSIEKARDEIIARSCEDMLSMSREGRKLFNSLSESDKKSIIEKVKEIIRNILDWVDELLGQYKSNSAEAKALRSFEEELNDILETWDKMLVSAMQANKAIEMSKTDTDVDTEVDTDADAVEDEVFEEVSETEETEAEIAEESEIEEEAIEEAEEAEAAQEVEELEAEAEEKAIKPEKTKKSGKSKKHKSRFDILAEESGYNLRSVLRTNVPDGVSEDGATIVGDNNIQFSERDNEYTEREYRDFGWARANNLLNAGQNADYRSKFADAKVGRAKFNKSKKGEYIIPVSDIYDPDFEGVNNVLVFAKGTIDKPIIMSIIEIYEYNETELDRIRRKIYELERRGIQPKAEELFRRYNAADFKMQHQGNIFQIGRHSDGNGLRGRSGEEASGTHQEYEVKYSERDNGEGAYDLVGEHKTLEKRYNKLKADFESYKERVKLDKTLTKGKVMEKSQLEAIARYLIKHGDSNYKASELAKILNDVYVDLQDGAMSDSMTWDEMYAKAYEVAEKIRSEAKVKTVRPAYYDMILKDIRSARIAPNDNQKGDAKHRFGDHYVGKFRGRVTIANDGTPLDIKWSEWAKTKILTRSRTMCIIISAEKHKERSRI